VRTVDSRADEVFAGDVLAHLTGEVIRMITLAEQDLMSRIFGTRSDPDLGSHPPGSTQANGRVLRGQGLTHAEWTKPPFESWSALLRRFDVSTGGDETGIENGVHRG